MNHIFSSKGIAHYLKRRKLRKRLKELYLIGAANSPRFDEIWSTEGTLTFFVVEVKASATKEIKSQVERAFKILETQRFSQYAMFSTIIIGSFGLPLQRDPEAASECVIAGDKLTSAMSDEVRCLISQVNGTFAQLGGKNYRIGAPVFLNCVSVFAELARVPWGSVKEVSF